MLCSIAELGLTTHDMPSAIEDGIFILTDDLGLKPGDDVVKGLMMNDTVVEFEGEILGKPANRDEAIDMLTKLSGNVHYVYTGVAVVRSNDAKSYAACEKTAVYFDNISKNLDEQ